MIYRKNLGQAPKVIILSTSPRSARISGYTLRGRRPSLQSYMSKRWSGLCGSCFGWGIWPLDLVQENVFNVIALGCIQTRRKKKKKKADANRFCLCVIDGLCMKL